MFINATGFYIPSPRVPNSYFLDVNGLDDEWITKRTGISSRSRTAEGEDQETMAVAAVDDALRSLPYDVKDVDLIVAASYTVYDTVATVAHHAQKRLGIAGAKAFYMSSACSSFINALEVVEAFFMAGKAKKALIISSEHNSYYSNDSDPTTGHLWGDGATAWFLSADRVADTDHEVNTIFTMGMGDVGKGPEGVHLRPRDGGISMPFGKDVFINACHYMIKAIDQVIAPYSMSYTDLDHIICHQANMRIVKQVAHSMELPIDVYPGNITELGNTGSASAAIVFSQQKHDWKRGEKVALTVFGGGYSCGAALITL